MKLENNRCSRLMMLADIAINDGDDETVKEVREHVQKALIATGIGLSTTAAAVGMAVVGEPEIAAATLIATGVHHFEQRKHLKKARDLITNKTDFS